MDQHLEAKGRGEARLHLPAVRDAQRRRRARSRRERRDSWLVALLKILDHCSKGLF